MEEFKPLIDLNWSLFTKAKQVRSINIIIIGQ